MPNSRPTPDPADLWNRVEAAQYLRQDLRTFDRRLASGKIPHYRLGNRVWFDPADLRSLVASGYNPATED